MTMYDDNRFNNSFANTDASTPPASFKPGQTPGEKSGGNLRARLAALLEGRKSPVAPQVSRKPRSGQPEGSPTFDWIAAALSAIFVGGLFLDGWAHNHGKVDQTFFTPWHAVLYSGFAIYALFLLVAAFRNTRVGYDWRHALPYGYGLSLIGAGIFAVGGVLDLIWHTLFGIEVDVQALLSPTHLVLATGLFLMITGPLRASWHRYYGTRALSWITGAPAVIALALLLSVMMFFTQFAHPLVSPLAANNPAAQPIRGDLYVMHASGYVQTRLTLNQQDASSPSWSPDGFHIAFSAGEQGKSGIFVIQDDASGMKRLTPTATDSSEPAWSPNGRQIAYVATLNGASHIMLMNADGTKPQQLTTGTGNDYGPQWSPNGRQIIFESNRSGDFNLYTISATGKGQPTQLTRTSGSDDFQPSWSPDGKLIAFVSTRDGDAQVFVMDAKGSGQRRLTNTGSNFGPAWRPGGKQIAFVSSRSGNDEIYLMNADGSHLVNLSNNAGFDDGVGLMAWSRDGRALAYGAVGHPAIDSEMSTALGIASILLQAALMMAILLLALRRWSLPPGVATLIFTVSAVLISFIHDEFKLIPVALVAGIAADVLLLVLRPGPGRIRQLRIFAFAVPVIFFALYFVALALTGGVAWVIHLWFGAPIMAGIVGLFLSYVTVPPNLGVSLPAFDK